MVKVTGPLFSLGASGTLGKAISYRRQLFGAQVEKKPQKRDFKSGAQLVRRGLFLNAVGYWNSLSDEEKDEYKSLAAGLPMTGFNLCVRDYLLGVIAVVMNRIEDADGDTGVYVEASEDEDIVRMKVADTLRFLLQNISPHYQLTGDVEVDGHLAVGEASVDAGSSLKLSDTLDTHPASAMYAFIYGNRAAGPQFTYGVSGGAVAQGTPSAAFVYGLYFFAQHNTSSVCAGLGGVLVQQQSGASGSGALSYARAFYASAGYWGGSKPAVSIGLDIEDQGHDDVGTAYGVRVLDQTASTVRLLELGPATPYLRVVGGGDPAAGDTNLFLKVGGTLKQVYVLYGTYLAVK